MFSIANIRRPGFYETKHDVGRILEAMLYYRRVHLVIDMPLFLSIWDQLGPEGTRLLLEHDSITSAITPESAAIAKRTGPVETHRPVFIRPMGDQDHSINESDRLGSIHRWLARQTKWDAPSRGLVRRVIRSASLTSFSKLLPDQRQISATVGNLVENTEVLHLILRIWAKDVGATVCEPLLAQLRASVIYMGEDLMVSSRPTLDAVVSRPDKPAEWSDLLGDVQNYAVELLLAGSSRGDMVSAPDVSQVALRQIDSSLNHAATSVENIRRFEEVVFQDARVFGRAFNEGRLSLEDALRTIDETAKFREWLADKPNDADLLREYHAAVTATPRMKRLPATVGKFVVFIGAGYLLDRLAPGLGLDGASKFAAATGLSAVDQFVVENVLGGWQPSTFVSDVTHSVQILPAQA